MKFFNCRDILNDNTVTIFLLHGVVNSSDYLYRNYNRKHILADEFDHFLKSLIQEGSAIPINDLILYRNGKSLPKKAFVITFDDGFENNLSIAAPILKKYNVPATFYITTGFVENNLMSWADRIDYAFEATANHSNIELKVPWSTNSYNLRSKTSRLEFLQELRDIVKNDISINHHDLASSIQDQMGVEPTFSGYSELDLKLDWNGVKALYDCDLFTIGGHTHNHPIMSFLSNGELNYEIETCLRKLKDCTGINITHFAYPEGLAHCYNDEVIGALKTHGIKCCPSAEHGVNNVNFLDDLFRLKRVFVD